MPYSLPNTGEGVWVALLPAINGEGYPTDPVSSSFLLLTSSPGQQTAAPVVAPDDAETKHILHGDSLAPVEPGRSIPVG